MGCTVCWLRSALESLPPCCGQKHLFSVSVGSGIKAALRARGSPSSSGICTTEWGQQSTISCVYSVCPSHARLCFYLTAVLEGVRSNIILVFHILKHGFPGAHHMFSIPKWSVPESELGQPCQALRLLERLTTLSSVLYSLSVNPISPSAFIHSSQVQM